MSYLIQTVYGTDYYILLQEKCTVFCLVSLTTYFTFEVSGWVEAAELCKRGALVFRR